MHVRTGGVGTPSWPLPIVAEFESLGIDQVSLGVAMASGLGALVPQEFGSALVDGVLETAEAEGAG